MSIKFKNCSIKFLAVEFNEERSNYASDRMCVSKNVFSFYSLESLQCGSDKRLFSSDSYVQKFIMYEKGDFIWKWESVHLPFIPVWQVLKCSDRSLERPVDKSLSTHRLHQNPRLWRVKCVTLNALFCWAFRRFANPSTESGRKF